MISTNVKIFLILLVALTIIAPPVRGQETKQSSTASGQVGDSTRRAELLLASMFTAQHKAEPEASVAVESSDETAFRQILGVEEERVEAYRRGNIATLERLLAPDFVSTNSYGEFQRREHVIRYLREEYLPSDQRNDDVAVRIYGLAAVVTGRTITSFVVNGRRATNHARFLRLWVKRADGWRNVVFQGTFVLRRFSEDPGPARLVSDTSGLSPEAGDESGNATEDLLRFEDRRLQALRHNDPSALERLLGPEYVFVDPLGVERTRTEILSGIARASGSLRSLRDEGVQVRRYGNVAVVTGRTIAGLPEPERTTSTRFTRVWVKSGSEWRLVAYEATDERARTADTGVPDTPRNARPPGAATRPPLVFTHVTVIDVGASDAKRALELDQTVVVSGEHVAAVGKTGTVRIPDGAQVIDATGRCLMPGLWDMHVHVEDSNTTAALSLFLANGVTGVRAKGAPCSSRSRALTTSRTIKATCRCSTGRA